MGKTVGRKLHKLSATQVQKCKEPGYHGDGGGLWLQVSPSLSKSWVFRYTLAGKAREMGLGPLHTVGLAGAREKALACRRQLLEGIDPIDARDTAKRTAAAAAARVLTFDQCSEQYIETHRAGWRNAKHAEQWTNTLKEYVSPHFGKLNVAMVDTSLVLKALQPIWQEKTETAKRLRGRIESVLAWATVRGFRSGDNPARWRNHLDQLLAAPTKIAKVEHHAALPYARMYEFMKALRGHNSTAARAVQLIAFTAVRTSEAFNARWNEIDMDAKVWVVPAERMKAGREHRIPLTPAAMTVLDQMRELTGGKGYIFPGAKEGKPLSNMAGLMLLRRLGFGDFTVHGLRSTFRQWAAECSNFPREVAEHALAHQLPDRVEAAYQRGDLFIKRAKLMQAWADFCRRDPEQGAVVQAVRQTGPAAA